MSNRTTKSQHRQTTVTPRYWTSATSTATTACWTSAERSSRRDELPQPPKLCNSSCTTIQRALVALEVAAHSPWISRLVEECGHQAVAANPRKLPSIYENTNKSDRVDAQYLARIARLDPKLLAPVAHRSHSAQAALALVRARDTAVGPLLNAIGELSETIRGYDLKGKGESVCGRKRAPNRPVPATALDCPDRRRPSDVDRPLRRLQGRTGWTSACTGRKHPANTSANGSMAGGADFR